MAKRKLPWKVGCAYPITSAYLDNEQELVLDRHELAEMSPELAELMACRLVVTASPEGPAVCVYERNRWHVLEEQLMALPNMDPEARWLQRVMLGHQCWLDEQEAVKLSSPLTTVLRYENQVTKLWILYFDSECAEIWSDDQLLDMAGKPEPEDSELIRFIRGEGADHRGRTLQDVLAMDDFWLEHTHDYIQWLFPIPEPSKFNNQVPVLTSEDRACFRTEKILRAQQQKALDRMLAFYGLERREERVVPMPGLNMKSHIWLKPAGHNHLRITRIIRSLQYCYQPEVAMEVQSAVIALGKSLGQVSEKSIGYWQSATD
tara:strand:+ start:8618 stop:9571 length:954 start_codon:yes stop_codon:yes gene_type:complete